MLCVLMKILSNAIPSKTKNKKKASGFQILRLYLSFSSDIVALKGLMKDDVRFISYRDCRRYTTLNVNQAPGYDFGVSVLLIL